MPVGSTASGLRIEFVTSVSNRFSADDLADLRVLAHAQLDFFLEPQLSRHHRIRSDHDFGCAIATPHAEAALFLDQDVTFDSRAFADLDITIDGLDPTAD